MSLLILCSLLGIGLILMVSEVLFVPGTTFVGIFGLIVSLIGIAYAFLAFPAGTAWWISGIAILVNLLAVIYGFRSGVWNRFSLKSSMKGGTFDARLEGLQVGLRGKTVSDLKPYGKALFEDQFLEVKSDSGFIASGEQIYIVRLENNLIIVKTYGTK